MQMYLMLFFVLAIIGSMMYFNGRSLLYLVRYKRDVNSKKFYIIYYIIQVLFLVCFMISSNITQPIGGIWLGFFLYYFMFNFIFTTCSLFFNKKNKNVKRYLLLCGLALTFVIVFLGIFNAHSIKVYTHEIKVDKEIEDLDIALISDIHLGNQIGINKIKKIVTNTNNLNPDLVLIAGDVFNGYFSDVEDPEGIINEFKKLDSRLGVFVILGNHDQLKDHDDLASFFSEANMHLLEDSSIDLGDISIIGRKDARPIGKENHSREEVITLMNNVDKNDLIILMDHQPIDLDEIIKNNVDISVSGHTHKGQIFPGNIITDLVYKLDHGYEKYDNTHVFVSSGVGFWGPPLRVGSRSEIMHIKVSSK